MEKIMNKEQALQSMLSAVVEAAEDKKAVDVVSMDVRGQCAFADYFVLATGRTNRQLKAIAQAVSAVAHEYGLPAKVEGLEAMEWLLIDLGDVVVHLFLPEVREGFQLERLWARSGDRDILDDSAQV
jgi:ribosome-associated protein